MPKTIIVGYRVSELDRSREFYRALGYDEIGAVPFDDGSQLVVLKFPEEEAASIELVHRPADGPVVVGGFDHLAITVDDLAETIERLTAAGLEPGPLQLLDGEDGLKISWITDPDGYRIELVEWPAGHTDGLTAADFAQPDAPSA